MSGQVTANSDVLIRSELWSQQLKEILQEELMAQQYVNWLTEFPDGTTFTIPSIGTAEVDDYVEDTSVKFRALDTGEFQFSITEYLSSGHYITAKMRQDSFYASQLEAAFVPLQHRAIMERMERDVLNLAMSQTTSNLNTINSANHRFVGSGTNETITITDFSLAKYALDKANVPAAGRVAIVDPSVEFTLGTLTNLVNMSNPNPNWASIVETGLGTQTGMRFYKNIFGFDIYISNFLADANETINGVTTAAGKANMFFNPTVPGGSFVGAWRQMPKVDGEWNKDYQREEYVTTARYGLKLFRPESLVCVLTDTDQVS